MRRTIRFAVAAVIVTATLTWSAGTSSADDVLSSLLPGGITLSSLLSSPDVAVGTTSFNGVPEPAEITLYAWPSSDSLSSLQPGDAVNVQPVADAISGSDGSFSLKLASLHDLIPFANSSNIVDFEIVATDANGNQSSWNFSRTLVGLLLDSSLNVVKLPIALGDPLSPDVTDAVSTVMDLTGGTASRPIDVNSDSAGLNIATPTCAWYFQKTLTPSWVIVGSTMSSTSGVSDHLSYSSGATSTLGVGVSSNGAWASWNGSGTASRSIGTTVSFPTNSGATSYFQRTQWQYAEYKHVCNYTSSTSYEAKPYTFVSGAQQLSTSARSLSYCTSYTAGSGYSRTSTNAVTWTDGVDLGGALGVSLSAESGYSTQVDLSYHFSVTHHLCGYVGYPGSSNFGYVSAKA